METSGLNLSGIYRAYADWVRKNPQTASEVESTVKWLSYFIAGKISNSVVLTELVYSASNLLVLFNDTILRPEIIKVNHFAEKIKIWLSILEYSEVFIELSSKGLWGNKGKWIIIVCVQILKCIAKLCLLLQYNEKIISCPAVVPYRRMDEKINKNCKSGDGSHAAHSIAFCLKQSGRIVRKVEAAPSLHKRLWKPPSYAFPSENDQCNNIHPDKATMQRRLIGEVLFTVKPLITLGAILKYGPSAWKPWFLSAAADLASLYLLQSKPVAETTAREYTTAQRLELSRRRLALLLYIMRSPFYERHSKNRIDAFLNGLSRNIPLAKILCRPIQQYIPHWQETYFYLWSS